MNNPGAGNPGSGKPHAGKWRLVPALAGVLVLVTIVATSAARADSGDIISVKRLGMPLAARLAQKAVTVCQGRGYQVTAVVVDRGGNPQVMMRNTLAPRFTIQIAQDKANAVILSGVSSSDFRHNRGDIRMEMNHVHGVMVLDGGVPIRSAGSMIGALGVSGAPGGDKDEACAQAAVDAYFDRLEMPAD